MGQFLRFGLFNDALLTARTVAYKRGMSNDNDDYDLFLVLLRSSRLLYRAVF
jgi:hypothetical protein